MSGSNGAPGAVNFSITAQDDVSAKFDKISKRVDGLTKNVNKTQKSFGALALKDMSGLAKRVDGLAEGSVKMSAGLLRAVEPLAVITSAATLAGASRLVSIWADWGSQLLFTSQNIGITATALQTWQNGAQLAGASASALSNGMQALGQNMWNAIGGRAPQITAAMQMLGIHWQNMNGSAKSVNDVLPQIADKIKALHNPFAQAAVATSLLGSAGMDLLPFLRLGAQGIAEYNAKAAAYGVTSIAGVAAANQLRMSQTGLMLAMQGLGLTIAQNVAPVLIPMIGHMRDWVAANRNWIASDITKHVKELGTAIKNIDWKDINNFLAMMTGKSQLSNMLNGLNAGAADSGKGIHDAISWLGTETGSGATSMGDVPILRQIGGLFRQHLSQAAAGVRDQGMAYFESQGWSKAHAASIMANVQGESAFNPAAVNPTSGASGLFQWLGGRASLFKNVFGVSPDQATPQQQFAFAQYELTHTETSSAAALHNSRSAGDGAVAFNNAFERNNNNPIALLNRYNNAQYIDGLVPTSSGSPDSMLKLPSGKEVNIGSGDGSASAQDPGRGATVTVDSNHRNAPPRSPVTPKSSNPTVKTGTVKVEQAMLTTF